MAPIARGRIWIVLLGVYLIITGLAVILKLSFDAYPLIMAIFAILIGILAILGV